MDNYYSFDGGKEELLASWLDGTLTPEEEDEFNDMCAADPAMQEILDANDQVSESYEELIDSDFEMPVELVDDFYIPDVDFPSDYSQSDFDDLNYGEHESYYGMDNNDDSNEDFADNTDNTDNTDEADNETDDNFPDIDAF